MTTLADRYHAKVLLFGEYTVLDGSAAVAIPLASKHGEWTTEINSASGAHQGLRLLKTHLTQLYYRNEIQGVDFDRLERDLSKGLSFRSTIPVGYGLGSSGALTAAFYDRYFAKEQMSLPQLKSLLGKIEGAFHGSSSGLDPLVSLLNMPLLVHPDGDIEILDSDRSDFHAATKLIDTGIPRRTAPLVKAYKHTRSVSAEFESETKVIADIADQLISSYVLSNKEQYIAHYKALSIAQLQTLPMLIPEAYKDLWSQGLEADAYYMKLSGAGGGGCLLLHVVDEGKTDQLLKEETVISIS